MRLADRIEVYQRGVKVPEGEYRLTPKQARRLRKVAGRAQRKLEQVQQRG